ncbi:unnamed protein product (macronuclear) [Paramecium tetraurelia]|uniref:Uncharacterized protein n=1 Tax=Paramecium tetraurelia TaxID=5888 RepID=A0CVH5_PARTE|nr:uncharacterized protein GSPATT00010960001 [Paramecium tetraurelia]CAK74792.1 unnamed protein product [Paramecium tetraurelia]|eukprot:XP_001442189.1 hypothetical protein (macronuclear) [Paramecium tetraurelia strain d4-2]
MHRDTFKSIWSNLDQALGDSSFSSYYASFQRRNTPNKYKSSKSELLSLTATRIRFTCPMNKRDRFVDLLLEARGQDNELDKITIENIERHFGVDFLQLESMHLKLNAAKVIGSQLKNDEKYLNVCLGNNQFGDEGFRILTTNLFYNRCIIHLDISKSCITPKGFRDALPYLKPIYTLVSLNLSGNRLSSVGSKALQQLVDQHGNIQFLNLYSTFSEIISGDFVSYNQGFNSLKNTNTICSSLCLNLQENELKDSGIEGINEKISHWNIQVLNLSECQITSHGLSRLVDRIVNHKYLESLILSKNNFGGSVSCLFKLLSQNNWLQKLNLSYCQIAEFSQISEGLKENKGGNKVGEHAIILGLYMQRLTHIKLNDCDLRQNVNDILKRLYYSNLKHLEINQNRIEDLKELKTLLMKNKEIEKITYGLNIDQLQTTLRNLKNLQFEYQILTNSNNPKIQIRIIQNLGQFEQERIMISRKMHELNEKKKEKDEELFILNQKLDKTKFEQELLTKVKEKELVEKQNELISVKLQFEKYNQISIRVKQ